ncbi:bifunctional [glutamine synthetase] adenylyltransferase/[glutamine synthetase]-adenylyl-L-tyrosine phosphorylase [Pseudooceanicola sp. MF1-13]|uniref:bifunctional [glutamine synthetase] adenylyltransferase/[glutamine synthetase]-adenylyl-L-tyrosine phosphorylase n=1 Tax=Pseudooceanicola sp. MF1-13 TaxID=3379095 RepID=UPI0038915823
MSFAERLTRTPRILDAERAADARAHVGLEGPVGDLIAGAGSNSPYLSSLIQKEAAWITTALDDPETALQAEYARLRDWDLSDIGPALRQGKRRVALLTALADLGGVWPLEEVTGHLTDFADLSVQLALRAALAPLLRRGKVPGKTEDDLDNAAGMVVLAMGKMGARELNYSSDIDLIVLFDDDQFDPDDLGEARAAFVRATRTMAGTLNDITDQGYVFRTDLRLRPDPSVTPVCLSLDAAERYYESLGRTWERAAYIKARPCAGDLAAGDKFLTNLRPFVWRKHLDYAAIQDAHDMRQAIRDHKGHHGAITLPGHDMKLGRGGIREIEFFAQFHQIIAGGRDADLRVRPTVRALGLLTEKKWIDKDITDKLIAHYRVLRDVEHRIQMVNDSQTHALPNSDDGIDRIAALCGEECDTFRSSLKARLEEVHAICEDFFARDQEADAPDTDEPPTEIPEEVITRWRSYPALRSARAQSIFDRLRPRMMQALSRAARPQEALTALDGFLAGLPAGVQLFSLFEANPQLIDLLADIAGTTPDLALYLSRNASVFDAVIGGSFFGPWPGLDHLTSDLTGLLEQDEDYEQRLDTTRRWQREWHFRVGVHHLRGLIGAEEAAAQYSDIADATIRGLWPVVQRNFARRHGDCPGKGAVVLGMGSLGARRLNARSDLDLIVIYDPDGVEQSDGKRPLATRAYYARLTQALVTALSAPTAEGRLYEVDMRLRPSGNQGPVATSWAAFQEYQEKQAWTWEHLALTLARPLAGSEAFQTRVEDFRTQVLSAPRDLQAMRRDVADMRDRIAQAKGEGGLWEMKIGRGRVQDIELLAQAGTLAAGSAGSNVADGLAHAADQGWITGAEADTLTEVWGLFWRLNATVKLLTDRPLDPDVLGRGGCELLLRELGSDSLDALTKRLTDAAPKAAAIIDHALTAGADDAQDPRSQ